MKTYYTSVFVVSMVLTYGCTFWRSGGSFYEKRRVPSKDCILLTSGSLLNYDLSSCINKAGQGAPWMLIKRCAPWPDACGDCTNLMVVFPPTNQTSRIRRGTVCWGGRIESYAQLARPDNPFHRHHAVPSVEELPFVVAADIPDETLVEILDSFWDGENDEWVAHLRATTDHAYSLSWDTIGETNTSHRIRLWLERDRQSQYWIFQKTPSGWQWEGDGTYITY